MRGFGALFRRELGAFFGSTTGYVTLTLVTLILCGGFVVLVEALNGQKTDLPLTEAYYDSFYFWLVALFGAPILTMRSFAFDRETGHAAVLASAPIGDWALTLAKFLSCWLIFLTLWSPLILCVLALGHWSVEAPDVGWPEAVSTFLGVALVGGVYVALGVLVSARSKQSLTAAIVTFSLCLLMFTSGFVAGLPALEGSWVARLGSLFSMADAMRDFVRGVIDTRHVIFTVSTISLLLFLVFKTVEARRWR